MLNFKCWRSSLLTLYFVFIATATTPAQSFMFDRSPEPGSVGIKLTESGVVADLKFEVTKHASYWYSIKYTFPENDQVERARVRKLLGGHMVDKTGKALEPGVSTPIHLSIFAVCKNGKEVRIYSHDVDPVLASWGQGYFSKNIGTDVLTPGSYRAHLINKRASPEFSSIPITFEIAMPAKTSFNPSKAPKRSEPCTQ